MRTNRRAAKCLFAMSLLAVALGATMPGIAADPPAGRGGGLVPGTFGSSGRATREELLREWDLDGNGTINKSEADVARARMRRKRLELQLSASIDPVTGLPRAAEGTTPEDDQAAEEPLFQLPPESPPSEPSRAPSESLPGLRAPGPQQPPIVGSPTLRPPAAAASGSQRATAPPASISARASWLPPQRLAPAITGGVRAGAPAATAGYGSGAWSDLNAGRRPASLQTPAEGTGGAASGTGGLLPSARQPGRTGAMILPTLPGRPTGAGVPGLPPAPTVSSPGSPRVTADEIGAEGP
jgi:hypothetical protein